MLTPWYSPSTPPRRRGYYDTRIPARGSVRMSNHLGGTSLRRATTAEIRLFWTGRVWVASKDSPAYSFSLWNQHRDWRGLAAPFSHAKKAETFDGVLCKPTQWRCALCKMPSAVFPGSAQPCANPKCGAFQLERNT